MAFMFSCRPGRSGGWKTAHVPLNLQQVQFLDETIFHIRAQCCGECPEAVASDENATIRRPVFEQVCCLLQLKVPGRPVPGFDDNWCSGWHNSSTRPRCEENIGPVSGPFL